VAVATILWPKSGGISPKLGMEQSIYTDKILKVRTVKGLSQEYMAQQLGLSDQSAYSKIEKGKSRLDLPLLEAIAKVFDMTAPELLAFDEKAYFSQCTGAMGVHSHNTYHAASAKERELYEARIAALEGEVSFLRAELEARRAQG